MHKKLDSFQIKATIVQAITSMHSHATQGTTIMLPPGPIIQNQASCIWAQDRKNSLQIKLFFYCTFKL